jgi:hypothetical protein
LTFSLTPFGSGLNPESHFTPKFCEEVPKQVDDLFVFVGEAMTLKGWNFTNAELQVV